MASAHLHIDEPRAGVFLGDGSGGDKLKEWYLNSGATRHMTGHLEHFANLDHGVLGSINFDNSS
jgi:hypothetical protein